MSPVVFRYRGYRFQFYANEGSPREPPHIHVVKPGGDAKFWLWPEVRLAYSIGYDPRAIRTLERMVRERREELNAAWNEFFGKSD